MTKHLRIELIIERMAHKRACRVLEAAGMTGYTVLPANGRLWKFQKMEPRYRPVIQRRHGGHHLNR
jgi:hypothetical protein